MTRAKIRPILAFAGVLLLGFAAAAFAQNETGAVTDTTRYRSLLDRLRIHPAYASSYSLNRTSRVWDQTLRYSRGFGRVNLSNNWMLKIKRDEAASNMRGKNGTMSLKLDYDVDEDQLLNVGIQSDFRRSSQLSNLRDQVDNNTDMSLALATKAPERAMHAVIPALREFTLTTDANFGLAQQRAVSRRATSLDSTSVNGSVQHYVVSFSGNIAGVGLDTGFDTDLRSGDSETRQRRPADKTLIRNEKDKTQNNTTTGNLALTWRPASSLNTRATADYVSGVNDYWDVQANNNQGGQERKTGRDIRTNVGAEWKPSNDVQVRGTYSKSVLRADFELQERGFRKDTGEATLETRLALPLRAGPLQGTEINGRFTDKQDDNDLEESASYLQKNRSLRAEVRQQVGNKLQVTFNNDVSFLQSFYEDRSLDRDERRILSEGVLAYTPSGDLSGYFSVNLSNRKTVNIPAKTALNNQTVDSYKVTGEVKYTRGRIGLGQRYTIQADYTIYDFAENKNTITRINGVQTNFTHRFTNAVNVNIAHEFQRRESGNYTRTTPSAPRLYRAGQSEIRHMLTLLANYRLGEHFRVEGRQMFDERTTKPMQGANPRVNATFRGEFSFKVDFDHEFRREFKFGASFQKTQSTSEKDYWNVRMDVERVL